MTDRKVGITDTSLRDAHQSLFATRMVTADMMPIVERMDAIGFHSMEVWGGATFDSCLRYLNEDPWFRLRKLKEKAKNTKLQMLLRGQNLVGYKHYPDDVVRAFVRLAVKNGVDIMRIFDALNDVRNMTVSMDEAKKQGAHVQACVVYTISPVHNLDSYVELALELQDLGADSICLKDMAGLLSPTAAFKTVGQLKKVLKIPVQVHSHYTSGMASMSYLKAVEAGADVIDTAISPFALSTSQPPTETMVAVLQETPYDTGLDLKALSDLAEYFRSIRKNYNAQTAIGIDTNVLSYQIPGGMVSNLVSQLEAQNAGGKLAEVLKEVPRVRAELGYPPLVTPMSQIVGTQSVVNVVTGERYKMIPSEVRSYVKGLYGKPPGPIDEELMKRIIGDDEVITGRPADLLEPAMEKLYPEVNPYLQKEEDLLSYLLFPPVALKFLRERLSESYKVDFGIVDEAGDTEVAWYPA